ncbi:MAG: gliding motility-associated C-terminal domain-containing protein, partial [Bacteroidota bacterium]
SLVLTSPLPAQILYGLTEFSELYRIDVANCSETFITIVNAEQLTDITFHPNGNLYAISSEGSILQIDTLSGNVSLTHELPYEFDQDFLIYNALTVALDGLFYATGDHGDVFTYNLSSDVDELLGNTGFISAGDLTTYDGELYLSSTSREIVSVDLDDPTNSSAVISDATNFFLFGLTSVTNECEGQSTFALDNMIFGGSTSVLYQVLWESEELVELCQFSNSYFGSASTTEFLSPPIPLLIQNIDDTLPACDSNNGSLSVAATGGTGNLSYSLDNLNFQDSNSFQNLAAGSYTVFVMDNNGCTTTQSIILTTAVPPEIIDINALNAFCSGNTASLSISASSEAAPLNYSIDGLSFQTNNTFDNLLAGIYTISVVDANNCLVTQDFELAAAPVPEITAISIDDTSCGENNGSITISTEGGLGMISYSVDGINFQASSTFDNLVPDEYRVFVIDENTCSDTTEVTVAGSSELLLLSLESSPSDCGENNGSIAIELQADLTDLQIIVNNKSYPSIDDINDLNCGEYTLMISDQFGCSIAATASIAQNECPIYIPNVFSPNDDGINDGFKIYPHPAFKGLFLNFKVFNRWGGLVYEIKDFNPQDLNWNGMFKGQASEAGVYTYFLEFTTENGGDNLLKGDFTLVK